MAAHTQCGERDRRLDGLDFTNVARLDRTEQGKEFVQLHLGDSHIVEEVLREGRRLVCRLDQPLQHRVRVDLKYPGHGSNAQAFSQSGHDAHEQLSRHAHAMHRRTLGLQEIRVARGALQLAPRPPIGMAIGPDIAQADPAIIATGARRAKMVLRGDCPPTPMRRCNEGRERKMDGLGMLLRVFTG
jgi:hypothetical protein